MSKVKEFFKGWTTFEKCWLVLSTVIMIVLSIIYTGFNQRNHWNSWRCIGGKRKSKYLCVCND